MKKFKITDMDGVSTCIYVIKGLEEKNGNDEYPFLSKIDVKEEKRVLNLQMMKKRLYYYQF